MTMFGEMHVWQLYHRQQLQLLLLLRLRQPQQQQQQQLLLLLQLHPRQQVKQVCRLVNFSLFCQLHPITH